MLIWRPPSPLRATIHAIVNGATTSVPVVIVGLPSSETAQVAVLDYDGRPTTVLTLPREQVCAVSTWADIESWDIPPDNLADGKRR